MEYLDIVDENGLPTGEIVERSMAHMKGIMHRTSHVWILRKRNDEIEILLQKRSDIKSSFPGCYDISSAGHIPARTDFATSAIRELKEELGVDAGEEELIFCADRKVVWDTEFNGKPFHDRQISRVFALWRDLEEKDFILQKEEVDSVKWIKLEELISAVKNDSIRHCIFLPELLMVKSTVEK